METWSWLDYFCKLIGNRQVTMQKTQGQKGMFGTSCWGIEVLSLCFSLELWHRPCFMTPYDESKPLPWIFWSRWPLPSTKTVKEIPLPSNTPGFLRKKHQQLVYRTLGILAHLLRNLYILCVFGGDWTSTDVRWLDFLGIVHRILGKFWRPNRRLVTPNCGLVRESLPNPFNSGFGIIGICPEMGWQNIFLWVSWNDLRISWGPVNGKLRGGCQNSGIPRGLGCQRRMMQLMHHQEIQVSNEKRAPGWWGYIADEKLPNYIGHYKTNSIMESSFWVETPICLDEFYKGGPL